ncbi:MAG: ATP-binding cassette domain-containing protein [Victivallales bacterium]|nr:ATP-binding cassette domain-containing protein [Victivallales bacterium]
MKELKSNQTGGNQESLIDVVKLTKTFEDITAVNKISFSLKRGEIFGFLGPNGAGKTTTINILTGLSRPDSGTIKVAGQDCTKNPKAAQHLIGIVPDESNLYPELSGFDNLCFCASLYGIRKKERSERARELLQIFGLKEAANRKFNGYSKGMKRKLTIAAGIIHCPSILFLDEPTTGIDVTSARQIRQLISDLNSDGTTIFLTTHYIEEAERLCDRIAFIVEGRIVCIDTVENLMWQTQDKHMIQFAFKNSMDKACKQITTRFPGHQCKPVPEGIRVESPQPIRVGPLVRLLEDNGIEVMEARKILPTLEDVFIKITGIEARMLKQEKEKMRMGGNE